MSPLFDSKHPFLAQIRVAYDLCPEGQRRVLHIETDLTGSGMKYHTGDHLAVWLSSHEEEVQSLLKVLGPWRQGQHPSQSHQS